MPNLAQFMFAFADQLPIHRPHGGGLGGSAQQEDYYRAQLKQYALDEQRAFNQYALDEQRAFNQSELSKLGEVTARINQSAQAAMPNMDSHSRLALDIATGLANSGIGTALPNALGQLDESQKYFAAGGVPTGNMREYEASVNDPGMTEFLRQKHNENIPAALQIAAALAKSQGRSEPTQMDLMQAAHIANPEQARAVEASKEFGKKEAETVADAAAKFPVAIYAQRTLAEQTKSMSSAVDSAINLIKTNPSSAGLVGTINKYLPETDATNLRAKLDMIKSGIALDTLSNLKKSSSTGASGFGALSEHELQVIQGLYGVAEQSNKPEELIKTLEEIKRRLTHVHTLSSEGIKANAKWVKKMAPNIPTLYPQIEDDVEGILNSKEESTKPLNVPTPVPKGPVKRRRWGE